MYDQGYEQSDNFGYAPGYDPYGGAYYGEDAADLGGGDGAGEGFFARLYASVQGYAATIAGGGMIAPAAGAAIGAYQYLMNDADYVEAAAWAVGSYGAIKAASILVAGGFEALSSSSMWYAAAFIAAGYALPMIVDKVQEATGFGGGYI
jgi:hypothetical protein